MKQSVFFLKYILLLILPILLFHSCIREEEFDNTPQGNFEALWKSSTSNTASWTTNK